MIKKIKDLIFDTEKLGDALDIIDIFVKP